MNTTNKRKDSSNEDRTPKRLKKECSYGEGCYRKNPAHFREFSHPHLETILDAHTEDNTDYAIPSKFYLQRHMIKEQLDIIVEKQIYLPPSIKKATENLNTSDVKKAIDKNNITDKGVPSIQPREIKLEDKVVEEKNINKELVIVQNDQSSKKKQEQATNCLTQSKEGAKMEATSSKERDPDYRPLVQPTRRIEDHFKVLAPKNKMAAKHAASAPFHIFYTTITDAKETHNQPYSITFQEILDPSLGELKASLQINFMVEIGWLLAHYYFAGYSNKKLTILYGEDCSDLRTISKKKPNVEAHMVTMATPFGKHHTKMMILCYEDGSLRVVISTANLYLDDWENRTQGLWFSPKCPELPPDSMPFDGESPTMFKKSLLKYLNTYHLPSLVYYVERVKRCDFSQINVFLVSSVPGSHFDTEFGMSRAGALLKAHCALGISEGTRQWPVVAQASSLGSYGKEPKLWLTGDFLHSFAKCKHPPTILTPPPPLQLIYPSLENVRQSHDNLLGGGCLPYAAELHCKQSWIRDFMFQWKAKHTGRDKAMPHIKSYTRVSPDGKRAAFYLLTSANVSKAAWGTINKGNGALRLMSYEAGVLFIPSFVVNKDFFSLDPNEKDSLVIPYDLPPTKYTSDMSPWVQDYMH